MDSALNPYVPGAGTPPPLLAGRDNLVDSATIALIRAERGLFGKSFIAVGLRGVGKTVVLNKIQEIAENRDALVVYIEANDDASLIKSLIPQIRSALIKVSRVEAAKDLGHKGLRVLKRFASACKVNIGEIEVGLDFGEEIGIADSGDILNDLPELFQVIGNAMKGRGKPLVIIIDEMQYLSNEELGALIMAMHRVNQRLLPIILVGAGLPTLLGKMGESKSYAERLFDFPRIRELTQPDAKLAVVKPASNMGVVFSEEAFSELYRLTQGYPYFLQEWSYVAWNIAVGSEITKIDIENATPEAERRLDDSFFRVRLERMTPTEKRYISAMAKLGPGPHKSGDIADRYGAEVSSVAPHRSSLIAKGMIYSPSYGQTDFTVPLFDQFIAREFPDEVSPD